MSYDRYMMERFNQDELNRVPKAKLDSRDAAIAALTEQRDLLKKEVKQLANELSDIGFWIQNKIDSCEATTKVWRAQVKATAALDLVAGLERPE